MKPDTRKMDFSSAVATARIARILAVLSEKPGLDRLQLAAATHMSGRQAYDYIRHMTAKGTRCIRVSAWRAKERGQGKPRPLYSVGKGPDAAMPTPIGIAVSKKRWWDGLRRDIDRYDTYLDRRRTKSRLANRLPATDPVLAALHSTAMPAEAQHGR